MKQIGVVQHRQYYYVHLFFIYTKQKIGQLLGKSRLSACPTKMVKKEPQAIKQKVKSKEKKENVKAKPLSPLLTQWLHYCDKKGIKYTSNTLIYWQNKLKNRLTIDRQNALSKAITKGWKDFYLTPLKKSPYHHLLGQSLKMDKACERLMDIAFNENRFIYQFENIKVKTQEEPTTLFQRYGYHSPTLSRVQEKVLSMVRRF